MELMVDQIRMKYGNISRNSYQSSTHISTLRFELNAHVLHLHRVPIAPISVLIIIGSYESSLEVGLQWRTPQSKLTDVTPSVVECTSDSEGVVGSTLKHARGMSRLERVDRLAASFISAVVHVSGPLPSHCPRLAPIFVAIFSYESL